MNIKEILKLNPDTKINISGWVRFNRILKNLGFIELFDGSNLNGIQLIYKQTEVSKNDYDLISTIPLFSALEIEATVVLNQKTNKIELNLLKILNFSKASENNPLQKKDHSNEFLREILHFRPRTKLYQAVFKIRSKIFLILHEFFNENDFIYVNSPIITANDAEGAGETFKVVTNKGQEFFSNPVSLSVSGQLQAESYAQAFKKVYTLAPTFRAENSNTQKHASEFWMLEPEIAFSDYHEVMDLCVKMLSYLAKKLKENVSEELAFLSEFNSIDLISRLNILISEKVTKLSYSKAIEILAENKELFEVKDIKFGLDLATEHEKFLATYFSDSILFIIDYPIEIKSFYMMINDDQKTVRGFDLIVPEIGELVGGSEREVDYDKLIQAATNKNVNLKDIEWYLNLRKEGYLKSTGFGLGIERLVMFLTGVKNIRDVISFPITPGKINF